MCEFFRGDNLALYWDVAIICKDFCGDKKLPVRAKIKDLSVELQ